MTPTSRRPAGGSSAGRVAFSLAALLGSGLCLVVAFLTAPALGVAAGLGLGAATLAGVAAAVALRRARRLAVQAEKLSGEIDALSQRLLGLERRAAEAAPAASAPASSAPDPRLVEGLSEVTAEIGLLGGIVRELAVAVAAQDDDLTRLKAAAAPPRRPVEAPAAVPALPRTPAAEPPRPAVVLTRDAAVPAPFIPGPVAAPPLVPGADRRGAEPDARREGEILAALADGGLEVHLQPVVSLPQRKVAFYEALTRLRLGEERLIPAEFMPVLERHGRTTELDRLMLARVTAVSRHLAVRGSDAAVAYALSPHSLFEPGFLRAVGRLIDLHPELSGRLILALPQRSWRTLDAEQAGALAALRERIGLALDRAIDLRLDPAALAARGVGYAKVGAGLLLRGAGSRPGGRPEDLVAALASAGIRVVAEGVEREADVPDLIDLDLPLAQGDVFSPPRIVRPEVLSPPPAPAEPEAAPPAGDEAAPARRPFRDFLRRAV
ncbi:MAG: EAL domain-containing protein [Methylobacterium frigidaeris]